MSATITSSTSSTTSSCSASPWPELLCPVRVSCAYIFRIRLGDEFLLVGESSKPLKPLGGGYRFSPETLWKIEERFGYYPASGKAKEHDQALRRAMLEAKAKGLLDPAGLSADAYDYRLLLEGWQLADFMRCFARGEGSNGWGEVADLASEYAQLQALSYTLASGGNLPRIRPQALRKKESSSAQASGAWRRENILDLRRELQEELQESGMLRGLYKDEAQERESLRAFAQLRYRYVGRYYDGILDRRFGCGALMLTDVVELMPSPRQLEILQRLHQAYHDQQGTNRGGGYAWVAASDFRSHLVPRSSQAPSSMAELLGEGKPRDGESSALQLADHCALLLTEYTVVPPSVQQCLQAAQGHLVSGDVITTPWGWIAGSDEVRE